VETAQTPHGAGRSPRVRQPTWPLGEPGHQHRTGRTC